MPDSKVVKARKRLKTIATGVSADSLTIDAARIFLGCRANEAEFAKDFQYALNQPVLTIGSANIGFSSLAYPLVVECELVVALAAQSAQEWCDVDNLVATLRAAWLTAASYPAGEVKAKVCDFEPFNVEVRGDQTIVRVSLLVAFENPDA